MPLAFLLSHAGYRRYVSPHYKLRSVTADAGLGLSLPVAFSVPCVQPPAQGGSQRANAIRA